MKGSGGWKAGARRWVGLGGRRVSSLKLYAAQVYPSLSRIGPITVLATYLLLIPGFALVFCGLPGQHFYAPYARLEPPALADEARVEKNISAVMADSYRRYESQADGWQVAHGDIEARDLGGDASNGLTFSVHFFATRRENGKITAATGGAQFTAQLSQKKIVTQHRPGWLVCHLVALPVQAGEEGLYALNRHLLFRPPELAIQADAVCWGAVEEIAFQNLLAGWSGDPRALSGFVWRMVYFSATTITTVGFGDIVPLTATARALVAIEAIAGWVLAGLFLNSLASRIARGGV